MEELEKFRDDLIFMVDKNYGNRALDIYAIGRKDAFNFVIKKLNDIILNELNRNSLNKNCKDCKELQ